MKTAYVCVLVIAVLFVGGCSSGESYVRAGYDFGKLEKVAVVDVVGAVRGEAAKNQIADFFTMELLKKGYAPVERAQVKSILKEHEFQTGGLTPEVDAVEAGKILNVPTVLLVNVPNFAEEMSITAKMIDVEDGSILWLGSGSGRTGRTLSTIAGAAIGAGAGAAVAGDDRSDKVLGGVVGGVLGGVAGHALSAQTAEKAQEIIKKICKDLPSRLASK